MPATYLTLLTIAFGSVWMYKRSSADVFSVIAALTTVICFIWGFAVAPWGVQLLIVGLLLAIEKYYWSRARMG
ncbi:MAG: hypothetical protein F6J93_23155 [Oscillatoria sp. SIO1A7]|nr:hypothetical protein [Oscillatoria sp. SIO1A7]